MHNYMELVDPEEILVAKLMTRYTRKVLHIKKKFFFNRYFIERDSYPTFLSILISIHPAVENIRKIDLSKITS